VSGERVQEGIDDNASRPETQKGLGKNPIITIHMLAN